MRRKPISRLINRQFTTGYSFNMNQVRGLSLGICSYSLNESAEEVRLQMRFKCSFIVDTA